jgi:hypothetical protein
MLNYSQKHPVTKDISVVTLNLRWSRIDTSLPPNDFFNSVEVSARVGNWSYSDKKEVCVLKLVDEAKAFYDVMSELHNPSISWDNFKAFFL